MASEVAVKRYVARCTTQSGSSLFRDLPQEILEPILRYALAPGHTYFKSLEYSMHEPCPPKLRSTLSEPKGIPQSPAPALLATCKEAYDLGVESYLQSNVFVVGAGCVQESLEFLKDWSPSRLRQLKHLELRFVAEDFSPFNRDDALRNARARVPGFNEERYSCNVSYKAIDVWASKLDFVRALDIPRLRLDFRGATCSKGCCDLSRAAARVMGTWTCNFPEIEIVAKTISLRQDIYMILIGDVLQDQERSRRDSSEFSNTS
ncbi:MAG: hypothetical protein M1817_006612 [Caeruleum heppii]|nr:MAG: hypothetical protein M1817_006612 [Caeruleum heppii]